MKKHFRFFGIVLLLLISLSCSTDNKQNLSYIKSPAGPHSGEISVVEFEIKNKDEIKSLDKKGFNVTDRRGQKITVYGSESEIEALKKMGYDLKIVEKQKLLRPNDDRGYPGYYNYNTLTQKLQKISQDNPEFTELSSLGKSEEGRNLWVLKVTNKNKSNPKPLIKIISTMHGDEPVGMELSVRFIDWVLTDYNKDVRITKLLDEAELWIVPLMNPDGLEHRTRYNSKGYDLNRSFPGSGLSEEATPIEVKNIMKLSENKNFILASNFHGGAVVVNYPYDDDNKGSEYSPTPDEELFKYISKIYSRFNPEMWSSQEFPEGITNGANWYSITGGMQDWNYRVKKTNEVTLEVSNSKVPSSNTLEQYWKNNKESIINYSFTVFTGVYGKVETDDKTDKIASTIEIIGNPQTTTCDLSGNFYRMLLPGTYSVKVSADGYETQTLNNVFIKNGESTFINVKLIKK